jgi:hypothetical protein
MKTASNRTIRIPLQRCGPAFAATMLLSMVSFLLPPGANAGETPPVISGTIEYTGALGPVSGSQPIVMVLSANANLDGAPVAFAVVDTNGGAFELQAPAAGDYYLAYLLDTNGDGVPAVGDPF